MKNYNNNTTPKQKKLFEKWTEIESPDVICREGGMNIALGQIASFREAGRANGNVLNVVLEPGCFATDFTAQGIPKWKTIDTHYANGKAIRQLGKAVQRMAKVVKAAKKGKVTKHIQAATIKRQGIELVRPELEPVKVRRY